MLGWLGGWFSQSDKMWSEILSSAIAEMSDMAECGKRTYYLFLLQNIIKQNLPPRLKKLISSPPPILKRILFYVAGLPSRWLLSYAYLSSKGGSFWEERGSTRGSPRVNPRVISGEIMSMSCFWETHHFLWIMKMSRQAYHCVFCICFA